MFVLNFEPKVTERLNVLEDLGKRAGKTRHGKENAEIEITELVDSSGEAEKVAESRGSTTGMTAAGKKGWSKECGQGIGDP